MRTDRILLAVMACLFAGSILNWDSGLSQTPPPPPPATQISDVDARPGGVKQNKSIDNEAAGMNVLEPVVEPFTYNVKVSVRMRAPGKLKFVPFSPGIYVDMVIAPTAFPPTQYIDKEGSLCVSLIFSKTDFGAPPIKMEGNLGGEGQGGPGGQGVHWAAELVSFKIKIPHGDPTTQQFGPQFSNETNELCFTSGTPGKLEIYCEAECSGGDPAKLRWKIEDAGEIKAEWHPSVDGDKHTGKGWFANAVFTGMPQSNSAFGPKKITLSYVGSTKTETTIVELFFDPLATNNPGPLPDDIPLPTDLHHVVIKR